MSHLDRGESSIRILFAGGCHVFGYPVGQDLGFTKIAIDSLSQLCFVEVRQVGIRKLSSRERLLENCKEFNPDVLLLQYGHLETILISARLHSMGFPIQPKTLADDYDASPNVSFQPNFVWRLKSFCRMAFDWLFCCLGHSGVQLSKTESEVGKLLADIRAVGIKYVLVLPPFPCLDPVECKYRAILTPIFETQARKHGCEFVQLSDVLPSWKGPWQRYRHDGSVFADAIHLSAKGHRRLGELIAKIVSERCFPRQVSDLRDAGVPIEASTT